MLFQAERFAETFIRADGTREMEVRTSNDGRVQTLITYDGDGEHKRGEDVLFDGNLLSQTRFHQGTKQLTILYSLTKGHCTTEIYFDRNGYPQASTHHDYNLGMRYEWVHHSRLNTLATYCLGHKIEDKAFLHKQVVRQTTYRNGQPVKREHFSHDGQLILIKVWHYKMGVLECERIYRPDMSLKSEIRYSPLGGRDSYTRYRSDGTREATIKFNVADRAQLVCVHFDQTGSKARTITYRADNADKVLESLAHFGRPQKQIKHA